MASSDPSSGGDGDRDVFGSLPKTRPQRRSAKRDRPGATTKAAAAPAAAKPKAPPKAKSKPAAKPRAQAPPPASSIPPAGYATPHDDPRAPRGGLVTTAVQAAGELAQIGVAAGGRAVKSALQRLPRP